MLRIYAEALERLRVRLNMYLVLEMFVFFRFGYYDFRGDSAAEGESMGLRYGDGVSPPHFGRVWGLEYFG